MKGDTQKKLEKRVKELEGIIESKGIGSDYVQKAKRMQRDLNIALMLGAATTIVGIAAWVLMSSGDE